LSCFVCSAGQLMMKAVNALAAVASSITAGGVARTTPAARAFAGGGGTGSGCGTGVGVGLTGGGEG
jgi:hypothetical protein